jgi:hypothetical protein
VYAEISSNLVAEKSPPIQVNKIYEIQHFKILPARSLYKPVEANFMIQFTIYTQTKVVDNPPATFPSYIYKLTSFEQIPDAVRKTEDFIGEHNVANSCFNIIMFFLLFKKYSKNTYPL